MKAVLIATHPKWCEKICHEIGKDKNGKPIYEKTIEVRKTKPSIPTPFKVYIYETYDKKYDDIGICWEKGKFFVHGCKKVIGEFVCEDVILLEFQKFTLYDTYINLEKYKKEMCLSSRQVFEYGCGKNLYGWRISDLKIYDMPKELSEFYKVGAKNLEELDDDELCKYCAPTNYGERRVHLVPNAGAAFCEGDYCEEAYRKYLEQEFALTRPPQGWVYVQELEV